MNASSEKLNIYCIPGLGTNSLLFKKINIPGCTIIPIAWLSPLKQETLPAYARRLSAQIDTSKPFMLLGVSFGGMCAVEIAKQLKPLKTILISSSKTYKELHPLLIFLKFVPIHFLVPDAWYIKLAKLVKGRLGVTRELEKDFAEIMCHLPENYFRRTVHMVAHWRNTEIPGNVIQIHGDADKVIPFRKALHYDYLIKKGSHLIILDKAEEINKIIVDCKNYLF